MRRSDDWDPRLWPDAAAGFAFELGKETWWFKDSVCNTCGNPNPVEYLRGAPICSGCAARRRGADLEELDGLDEISVDSGPRYQDWET